MVPLEGAAQTLQATGKRITAQRRLLLKVLAESRAHLDAEEIYTLAKEKDPNISLATVYRTLNVLTEAGLVEERANIRDSQRHCYEVTDKIHYHFTCLSCQRVIEFEAPLIEQAIAELAERLSLDIVHTRVHADGYCPACRQKMMIA